MVSVGQGTNQGPHQAQGRRQADIATGAVLGGQVFAQGQPFDKLVEQHPRGAAHQPYQIGVVEPGRDIALALESGHQAAVVWHQQALGQHRAFAPAHLVYAHRVVVR
jgi:hypothetical protein